MSSNLARRVARLEGRPVTAGLQPLIVLPDNGRGDCDPRRFAGSGIEILLAGPPDPALQRVLRGLSDRDLYELVADGPDAARVVAAIMEANE